MVTGMRICDTRTFLVAPPPLVLPGVAAVPYSASVIPGTG